MKTHLSFIGIKSMKIELYFLFSNCIKIFIGRKHNLSLPVGRLRGGANSPLGSSSPSTNCIHRRHIRLESLRTLVLADNELTRLSLYLDDGEFSIVHEIDENQVSYLLLYCIFTVFL